MTAQLPDTVWPMSSLGDALLALADAAKLPHSTARLVAPSGPLSAAWLTAAAQRIGLEAESVEAVYGDVAELISRSGPALIVIGRAHMLDKDNAASNKDGQECPSYVLAVLGASRSNLRIIAPDLSVRSVSIADVCESLCRDIERPHRVEIETLLGDVGISGPSAAKAQAALLRQKLSDTTVGGVWLLRAPGHGEVHWGRWLTLLIGAHLIEQSCTIAAWSLLGWMTLSGRLDSGWLWAWWLLLISIVPFQLLSLVAGGRLSLEFGASLRRRLLAGALRLDPDRVRVEGAGGLLGRVLEAETVEQLVLGGGLTAALSLIELTIALGVLGPGAGQWGGAAMLIAFVALAAWLARRNLRARSDWTDARLSLTNNLVERMIGHRTTLAQETRDAAASEIDQALDHYLAPSTRLDRSTVTMQVLVPRAWLLFGLLWLGPGFVSGSESVTTLAISLGGLMLARQGLKSLVEGLDKVTGAAVAWHRFLPFLANPEDPEPIGDPDFAVRGELVAESEKQQAISRNALACGSRVDESSNQDESRTTIEPDASACRLMNSPRSTPSLLSTPHSALLEGRELLFRHARRSEPVLRGVDIAIRRGDRVLLEGPSGGGKSTLAALLAGSRTSQAGVLLLRGLDRQTLGAAWRRRVVLAPQFHHNHVLMGTFLFNLLLGRAWPPSRADVADAEKLCRTLDLGPLIDRMPGGLLQIVGETGWQLSHGERSRLFLARALLQRADLVLLDESFAALDPETLSRTLPKVLDQAPTLVVIAHP